MLGRRAAVGVVSAVVLLVAVTLAVVRNGGTDATKAAGGASVALPNTTTARPTTTAPADATTSIPSTAPPASATTEPAGPAPVDRARLEALALPVDACLPDDGDDAWFLVGDAYGDVDGDGVGDGLASVACHAGMGNREEWGAWVVFADHPEPIPIEFGIGIATVFELDLHGQSIDGGVVVLDIGFSHDYDAHCCSTGDARETYGWDGGGFVLGGRTTRDADSSTAELLAGDTSRATPEVGAAVGDASAGHGGAASLSGCATAAPSPRMRCTVTFPDGATGAVEWDHPAFMQWRAVAFSLSP